MSETTMRVVRETHAKLLAVNLFGFTAVYWQDGDDARYAVDSATNATETHVIKNITLAHVRQNHRDSDHTILFDNLDEPVPKAQEAVGREGQQIHVVGHAEVKYLTNEPRLVTRNVVMPASMNPRTVAQMIRDRRMFEAILTQKEFQKLAKKHKEEDDTGVLLAALAEIHDRLMREQEELALMDAHLNQDRPDTGGAT